MGFHIDYDFVRIRFERPQHLSGESHLETNELRPRSLLWAAGVSMLWVLPLFVLPIFYFIDNETMIGLVYRFGMGFFVVGFLTLLIVPIASLFVELPMREHYLKTYKRFPWFSVLVVVAMLTFFIAPALAVPLVTRNPKWSRVIQRVDWVASNNQKFVLVLNGSGNRASHQFINGWLNWTGKEPSGIPTIKFDPIRFGWWENSKEVFVDATESQLRIRVDRTALSKDQLDSLAPDIWKVLSQANESRAISSPIALLHPMSTHPTGNQHVILGCVVWMITMTLLFQFVGQLTLTWPAGLFAPRKEPRTQ